MKIKQCDHCGMVMTAEHDMADNSDNPTYGLCPDCLRDFMQYLKNKAPADTANINESK